MGVGEEDFEGVFDLLLICASAHVKKVSRAAARVLNNIHRRHGQAGPIDHAGDGAVQLDVVEGIFAGLHLKRVFFGGVAQRLDFRMTEKGIVVESDLGVERKELVIFGGDEGIDLHQRSVSFNKGLVQALKKSDSRGDLRGFEP